MPSLPAAVAACSAALHYYSYVPDAGAAAAAGGCRLGACRTSGAGLQGWSCGSCRWTWVCSQPTPAAQPRSCRRLGAYWEASC